MAENGNGATASDPQKLALLERAFVNLQSVLDDRVRYGASIGMSYNGQRDIYSALGWHTYLSFDDFYLKYQRQDIAGRIVDLPVDACWRDGFELQDDENKPDVDTPFIKSWKALDKRLGLAAWLTKLDRLSGIGRYGVLYLGVRNQNPVMPLAKTNEQALSYLSVFVEPNALIDSYDTDLASERFGLPVTYSLKTNDFSGADRVGARQTRSSRSAQVHWSRCIHCAEMTEDVKTLGTPRLQRVFNLLEALQLVTGGSSEAFWRSARPRYHANVGKEAQGFISPEELEGLGDQLAKMVHNYQDWIRTSYTTVDQLAATPADPSGHVAVILDLMSSAVAIPKRILLGSERGELASSQDAMEWAHRIAERQQSHVEPNIIRPFIDRLVEAGIMPEPSQGEYEIQWPDLTGPSADQRATLADRVASAEARHAQAEMLGKPSITRNELRELLGLDAIDAMDEEVPGETPPLPSKPAPPAPAPGQPQVGPDGKPVPGAPPQEQPAKPEQPAKAAAGLRDFASTQLNLIGADAAMVLAVKLPANCARETNPHITVRYGVEQDEPGAALAKALAGVGPVTARIDGYRVFQPEHEAGDVPVLTVSSPALAELRALVERHCECAPPTYDYAPHVTLGTCAGALAVPLDVMGLIGRELSFDTLTFGARDGTVTTLPLVQPAKAAEAQSGGPFVGADADADLRVNALFATIMAAVNAATDRIFGAATMDSIRAALIDFGQRMVARFGRPEQEFDLATQSAIEYLRGYGAEHVAGIGDTTRKLLRDTLTEGLRNGEDQAALARRVKLYFRGVSAGRARVIAATESHNATQHGAFVGLLQAGVTAKQWISGEHVTSTPSRPTHRELHGQIRHIGDPFVHPVERSRGHAPRKFRGGQ